jgi:hypothetical protein
MRELVNRNGKNEHENSNKEIYEIDLPKQVITPISTLLIQQTDYTTGSGLYN